MATLTYVYADSTAVLGPLATFAEPHAYDLCDQHSERLSAPRGWEVLRLAPDPKAQGPSSDDLLALADAVREAARPLPQPVVEQPRESGREVARKVLVRHAVRRKLVLTRFAHHQEPGLRLQQRPQAGAQHGMVVHQQDADLLGHGCR